VGLSGLALSPYVVPQYSLLALWDFRKVDNTGPNQGSARESHFDEHARA
jgi:hypothetical protein